MRFLFALLACLALAVGCQPSPSNNTPGNSTSAGTVSANQVSFAVSGVT
ncbi:MAG: hypothetical protein ABGX05_19400 [Pirellulaceae bacterium]